VLQEGFQVEESQPGRQKGEKCDDHHDYAHARPIRLESAENNQDQGITVHNAQQPGIDFGLNSPDKKGLGHTRQTHQDYEGWQAISEQNQKDKFNPSRKIVEPPLLKPVHKTSSVRLALFDGDISLLCPN
jgi:hypothetical protein